MTTATSPDSLPPVVRLRSVDLMRGATVALMVLVNNPGSWGHIFAPFRHASWHGCTPTDLVFPFFLFIVGVSIPLSHRAQRRKGLDTTALQWKAWKRAAILFALGLFLVMWPFVTLDGEFKWRVDFSTMRILGVLQRIALCYLVAASCVLWLPRRARAWVTWGALIGYWLILRFVPIPEHGAFAIDSPATHVSGYVDRFVLGEHLWSGSKRAGYDPEGILSTLGAVGTCLLGVGAGERLLGTDGTEDLNERLLGLFAAATGLGALAYGWSYELPLNKPIWTSSYAVATAAMAMLVLATSAYFLDRPRDPAHGQGTPWWQRPILAFGRNAILMFVLSGMVAKVLAYTRSSSEPGAPSVKGALFHALFESWLPATPVGHKVASLLWALLYVGLFAALAMWLDRRRLYFKV